MTDDERAQVADVLLMKIKSRIEATDPADLEAQRKLVSEVYLLVCRAMDPQPQDRDELLTQEQNS